MSDERILTDILEFRIADLIDMAGSMVMCDRADDWFRTRGLLTDEDVIDEVKTLVLDCDMRNNTVRLLVEATVTPAPHL